MNHKLARRRIIQMGSAASALVALPGLHAQARYPDRPVRIVVPFAAGVGGINHLALEMLKVRTGVAIEHVPYRGIAPATQDLIGGQVQLLTGTVPALLPLVRDGRIKPLAVTSAVRSTVLPDVPSMVESGLDGVDILNFFALAGPHGLPEHIVQTLNEALAKIVQMSDVQARFKAEALEAATGTPKALADFLSRDLESWKQIVAAQNIKLDAL